MKILVGCILMMAISAWIPLSIASKVTGKLTMEAAAIANGNAVASVNDFADVGDIDNMWSVEGPTLYIYMPIDGTGHRMYEIIMGLAVAMETRMKFRILSPNEREYTKLQGIQGGVNFIEFMVGMFGETVGNRIIDQRCYFKSCYGYNYKDKGCMANNILLLKPNSAAGIMPQLPLRMKALIRDALKKQYGEERMALTAIGNGWGDPNSEA
eukprot:gene3154-9940_t